jgi:hypothetical protein
LLNAPEKLVHVIGSILCPVFNTYEAKIREVRVLQFVDTFVNIRLYKSVADALPKL